MKKLLSILTIMVLCVSTQVMAFVPENGLQQFRIYNNGTPIGYHTLQYSKDGDKTVVDINIDMKASLLFLPVYSYKHTNTEVWNGDQLLSIKSQTNDNGNDFYVRADRDGDAIAVESTTGQYDAPLGTLSTTYWHEDIVQRNQLINTQNGKLIDLEVVEKNEEPYLLKRSDKRIPSRHYRITGDLEADLWYAQDTGEWIGLKFKIKGNTLEYERIPPDEIDVKLHKERY